MRLRFIAVPDFFPTILNAHSDCQFPRSKKPTASNTVTVHYSGWTPDGVMFDSSVARGEPTSFPLNRVIKGWTEGLQLQEQGSTVRFWIPAELAYGANPPRGAPGGQLCFDVELLVIR